MKAYGPAHVLVLAEVDGPVTALDYTIEHPGCVMTDVGGYDDHDCYVAFELRNVGLSDLIDLQDMTPGRYVFRPWTESFRYQDGTEHDAGFEVVASHTETLG